METLGVHIILEFYGCDPNTLKDRKHIEEVMVKAAEESNAHVIGSFFHQFNPHGVSGVIIIEESHLSIHTWPEFRYAAIDFFYCSASVDPGIGIGTLKEFFKPEKVLKTILERGIKEEIRPVVETK